MPHPQQPEFARNRRSAAAADEVAPPRRGRGRASADAESPAVPPAAGPVPEDNLPGHHPPADQDKPDRAPPVRRTTAARRETTGGGGARKSTNATNATKATKTTKATKARKATKDSGDGGDRAAAKAPARRSAGRKLSAGTRSAPAPRRSSPRTRGPGEGRATTPRPLAPGTTRRFSFAFEPAQLVAGLPFGITPLTTSVTVTSEALRIRYGPWSLETPLDNVAGAEVTGPYQIHKIAGPAHVSLADRGVTFATRRSSGVCIRFHEPVPAALPRGLIRHPGATVTVTEPEDLIELLTTSA